MGIILRVLHGAFQALKPLMKSKSPLRKSRAQT